MILKEYKEMLINLIYSDEYYVMESVLENGKGEVRHIVPNSASWKDVMNTWVQSATGLSIQEFEAYNKLSKEEKDQMVKLAKLNNLKKQVEALEKEIK